MQTNKVKNVIPALRQNYMVWSQSESLSQKTCNQHLFPLCKITWTHSDLLAAPCGQKYKMEGWLLHTLDKPSILTLRGPQHRKLSTAVCVPCSLALLGSLSSGLHFYFIVFSFESILPWTS